MKINQSKLTRQLTIINNWWTVNGSGCFEAVTGFGKTYVILLIIKRMTDKFPNYRTTVIVPSSQLKEDWESQIVAMNLPNVSVYVVNTYVKIEKGDPRLECELLAADELHHYCSEEAGFFNKVVPITKRKWFIGASATLEQSEITFLARYDIPLFDSVPIEEAEANGWVAPSTIYNLGLTMTAKDTSLSQELNDQFKKAYSKFAHNFDLMMACTTGKAGRKVTWEGQSFWQAGKDWRAWWAREQGYSFDEDEDKNHPWHPDRIMIYALQGTRAMRERKDFLYNVPSKMDALLKLLELFKGKKIIVFCESQKATEELETLRPDIVKAYHSNLKTMLVDGKKFGKAKQRKQIVRDFEDPNHPCTVIACVQALDEGFNVESIEVAILHSYNSKKRRDIQRRGRAGRIDYDNLDKHSIIVNLYMVGSHELSWLKTKQKGLKSAYWVTSVAEIKVDGRIASLV
jgi:superfamily II DNA or RNA helicase